MGLQILITLLVLLVLGLLGAASVIIRKKPEAKEFIDKLARFSGLIGIVSALWGIWYTLQLVLSIGSLGAAPLVWLTGLASGLVMIGLGFVFGYGLVAGSLSAEARSKGEALRLKLVSFQVLLGWIALGLFAWWIVLWLRV